MDTKQLLLLLDEYDEAWKNLHEYNVSKLTPEELLKDKGDGFRPLFKRATDLSFAIIEAWQTRSGSHIIPTRKDARLDTDAIRNALADAAVVAEAREKEAELAATD